MKPSIAVKSLLASSIYHMGLVSLSLTRFPRSSFVILTYHRVISRSEAKKGVQGGMYVEPETLECHIKFLKKYFSIQPISEILSSPEGSDAKPSCALTFDDGWHDFYTNCYPILKAYEVPAMVFLPTDFIGTENSFWTDRLSSLIYQRCRHSDVTTLSVGGQPTTNPVVSTVLGLKGSFESCQESAIALLKMLRNEDIEKAIAELSSRWGIEPKLPGRLFLSWEKVSEMQQTGLISFGSHTATHRILTTLRKGEIQEELMKSREELIARKAADASFVAFSYPNGNYNDEICQLVRDEGYSFAVTTKRGWNRKTLDAHLLKRFGMHQAMASTPAMLGSRITGFF